MIDNLFLDQKIIKYQKQQPDFGVFLKQDQKNQFNLISQFNQNEIWDLYSQTNTWKKNVITRVNFVIWFTTIFSLVSIIGLILLFLGIYFYIDKHNLTWLISGLVLVLISVIISLVCFFADNWNNQFMLNWKQYLEKLKPYLNLNEKLPYTVMMLYEPKVFNIKQNSSLYLLKVNSLQDLPKKLKHYINSQISAQDDNESDEDMPFDKEMDWYNVYKYWGNLQAIYEWACFLNKFCKFYLDQN